MTCLVEPTGHKKNRFESRNGGGATTRKNGQNVGGKSGETDGGQNLPVLSRSTEQCPALHQQLFGLKHDAKLRNDYGRQLIGNITFLLRPFFKKTIRAKFLRKERDRREMDPPKPAKLFSRIFVACAAPRPTRNFGCSFRYQAVGDAAPDGSNQEARGTRLSATGFFWWQARTRNAHKKRAVDIDSPFRWVTFWG